MKAESTIKPKLYSVENCGGIAEVVLYENIKKQSRTDPDTGNNSTYYTYDEYRLNVPYRDNLSGEIAANRSAWLSAALAAEEAKTEKQTLEEKVATLEIDNAVMGAAIEEIIAVVVGGE